LPSITEAQKTVQDTLWILINGNTFKSYFVVAAGSDFVFCRIVCHHHLLVPYVSGSFQKKACHGNQMEHIQSFKT
ncbi:MAG TPA: hypothetical protein PK165_08340, partial [bacterium]|nr:hypothetical protein [bacterium]